MAGEKWWKVIRMLHGNDEDRTGGSDDVGVEVGSDNDLTEFK